MKTTPQVNSVLKEWCRDVNARSNARKHTLGAGLCLLIGFGLIFLEYNTIGYCVVVLTVLVRGFLLPYQISLWEFYLPVNDGTWRGRGSDRVPDAFLLRFCESKNVSDELKQRVADVLQQKEEITFLELIEVEKGLNIQKEAERCRHGVGFQKVLSYASRPGGGDHE